MIEVFLSVVHSGSFSGAGRALYMSQSAVSQQIDKLEEQLGVLLFDRSYYRPRLTKAGQYYYDEVSHLEKQYHQIEMNLNKFKTKSIVIGITGVFEKKYLPDFIKSYSKQHNVRLELKYYSFGHFKEELDERRIDLAFGLMNSFRNIPDVYSQVCYRAHICVIVSLDHPLAKQDEVDVSRLYQEPVIVLDKNLGTGFYDDFIAAFEKDGYRPQIVKSVETQEDLIMSVRMNEGIAFTAREVIQEDDEVHMLNLINSHHQAYYGIAYENHEYAGLAEALADYFKTISTAYKDD